jgi:hypothetical protein
MNDLAPIVLFVYNRPWHTRQTLEALIKNDLAAQSTLYIYSDGPKADATEEQKAKIAEVRKLLREKKWCKEVHLIEAEKNKGIDESIIGGITEMFTKTEKLIIMEDDIVTSPSFLTYMNDALRTYENDERVMHISGYMFPVKAKLPETFFYNSASVWGWGTWKRAWKNLTTDLAYIWKIINDSGRIGEFTLSYTNGLDVLFKAVFEGRTNPSWDFKWHGSVFIQKGFCLHPGMSLVRNIGHDSSGVHCKESWNSKIYHNQKIVKRIKVKLVPVIESSEARNAIEGFNKRLSESPLIHKVKHKIKRIVGKLIAES